MMGLKSGVKPRPPALVVSSFLQFRYTIFTALSPIPAITRLPSEDQQSDNPLAPSDTVLIHLLLRTSQKRTVLSVETDASSASFVGFHTTFSMADLCPLSSVLFLMFGFSGFHMRNVPIWEPVAMNWPVGFQAIVRILGVKLLAWWTIRSWGKDLTLMRRKKNHAVWARCNFVSWESWREGQIGLWTLACGGLHAPWWAAHFTAQDEAS